MPEKARRPGVPGHCTVISHDVHVTLPSIDPTETRYLDSSREAYSGGDGHATTFLILRFSLTICYCRGVRHRSLVALAAIAVAAAGCGSKRPGETATIRIVAAESVWGDIAGSIAGARAEVRSIIASPAVDPHAYDPTASNARALADANLVIVNGIGYDTWAEDSLEASPSRSRVTVDVGSVLGLETGANPHQWYAPGSVRRVVHALADALARLDPDHRAGYLARARSFLHTTLRTYNALRREISHRYSGVAVGYSESIFEPLGASLGLHLATPASLPRAITEGTEPTAADIRTAMRQASHHDIAVWVVNAQNMTPEIQRITDAATAAEVPVVAITETPSPVSASFAEWQTRQLRALRTALHQATDR